MKFEFLIQQHVMRINILNIKINVGPAIRQTKSLSVYEFFQQETSTEMLLKVALKCTLSQVSAAQAASAVNVLTRRCCLMVSGFLTGVFVGFFV